MAAPEVSSREIPNLNTGHVVTCELEVNGRTLEMPIPFDMHPEARVMVVTGYRENDTSSILSGLEERGTPPLAVLNLPYPTGVRLTPGIMLATIVEGLNAVSAAVNIRAGRPPETPIEAAGHSKGFGELAIWAIKAAGRCSRLTGAAPLGANMTAKRFGKNPRQYRREITKALTQSGLFQGVGEDLDLAMRMGNELNHGVELLREQDGRDILRRLHRLGILREVVIGRKDRLCPPKECKKELGIPGFVKKTRGGHDDLSTESGLDQLALAITRMEAGKPDRRPFSVYLGRLFGFVVEL